MTLYITSDKVRALITWSNMTRWHGPDSDSRKLNTFKSKVQDYKQVIVSQKYLADIANGYNTM